MSEAAYALEATAQPKLIHWDEHWPQLDAAILKPTFQYALGVPPKKEVANSNICPFMVRPVFRILHNESSIYSGIIEFYFTLHLLAKNARVKKEFFFEAIKTKVHPFYREEFLAQTGRKLSHFYNLQESEKEILRTAEQVLKENGWL